MKQRIRTRIVSMALALLLLLALPVPALADEGVVKNPQDYEDMVRYVQDNNLSITLTDQYFSVDETFSGQSNFKFELSTDSDQTIEAFFCVLLRGSRVESQAPAMGLGMAIPMSDKAPTVSFSQSDSRIIELKGSDSSKPCLQLGARIGLNVLTEVEKETTITLKIYANESQISATDEPVKTVTFTVQPKTSTSADAITLNITGEDRSTAADGLQVYAGDTVTVGFTVPENYTGTNLTFTYNSAVFSVGTVPNGWKAEADGSYSYSGSGPVTADALGEFTFQAIAQSDDNQTGEFTITDGTNTEKESVTVIYKTIQYTIQDANEVSGHYQRTVTYNGQQQSITIRVTEPTTYTIQYAEADGDTPIPPGPYKDTPPEYTGTKKGATGYESRYIYYKIEAEGYKTVSGFVDFFMNPAEATITVQDITIYVGDTAPTTFGYDVTGLIESDKLTQEPNINIDGTVDTSKPGTYTIRASGASAGDNYNITYISGNLTVKEKTVTPGGSGGSGGGGTSTYYTLYFATNGGSAISAVTGSPGALIDLGGYVPVRSGYAFMGWYADPALTMPVYSVRLTGSTTVYAGWRPLMTPPKTGDGPSAWGWVCLLPLGCLGLAALWRRRAR